MAVQRLQYDQDGNPEYVDTAFGDSSGLDFANAVLPLAGPLPNINPQAASTANRAVCDALVDGIALALGSGTAAAAIAGGLISDLENRVDSSLGVVAS